MYEALSHGRTEPAVGRLKVVHEDPTPDDTDAPFIEVGANFPAPSTAAPRKSRAAVFGIKFRATPGVAPLASAGDRLAEGLIAFHEPDHPVAREYRILADEIATQLFGLDSRVIALGGAAQASGTTTVALNLALTLARQNLRVAIVDARAERPAVAGALGLATSPGLSEVLADAVPLTWALHPTGVERLTAVPAGAGRLKGEKFAAFVSQLRRRFDWVVIDGVDCVDAIDAAYLVVREDGLHGAEVADAHERVGEHLRGYIVTG